MRFGIAVILAVIGCVLEAAGGRLFRLAKRIDPRVEESEDEPHPYG